MSQSDSAEGAVRGARRKHNLVFWVTPVVAVLGGVAYLVTSAVSGHPALGIVQMAMMFVFAAALVLAAKRSETVQGLMDHRDERLNRIDLRATAFSGLALILAVLIGAFVELGRGHSGAPYTWLAAIAGLAYILAVIVQRVRQ
jgi:hypothetical protein